MYILCIIVRYSSKSQVFRTFLIMRLIVLYNFERYYLVKKAHHDLNLVFDPNEAQRAQYGGAQLGAPGVWRILATD